MAEGEREANAQRSTSNSEFESWALSVFLNLVPDRIQPGQIDLAKFFTLGPQLVLEPIEAIYEFIGRFLQSAFRIESTLARQVYDREKQIPYLFLDRELIMRGHGILHFAEFFVHLRGHIFQI